MLTAVKRTQSEGVARAPDRTRIAVQVRGDGPPLLLLPGQANNHHWWDLVRDDFAPHHMTVTFDYRGTGDSDAPDIHYSTRQFAQDSVAVLDFLGIASAHVYGTSMGGRVAQWVAADAPDRVRRLVLGCTTAGGPHSIERSHEVRRSLVATAATVDVLADLMYTPAYRHRHPGPYDTLGDPTMPPYARRRHLVASNEHDAWDALPDIIADTLILHGTDDQLAPYANADLLAGRISRSTLHPFDGARHAYFEECREEAGAAVLEFLRD